MAKRIKVEEMERILREYAAGMKDIQRVQSLRTTVARYSRKARKTVAAEMRSAPGWHTNERMARVIRAKTFKSGLGFVISVRPRGNRGSKGFYKNRYGLMKPVLMWMDEGTKQRTTRSASSIFRRKRKGHNTGQIKAVNFMNKSRSRIETQFWPFLEKEYIKTLKHLAKKHGFI